MTILEQAKPITEFHEAFYFKGLLVGDSGTGKTEAALTLAGPKLLIDTDCRSAGLDHKDTSIIQFPINDKLPAKTWNDLVKLKEELWILARSDKPFPYSAIIFDGLSSLGDIAMRWALELTGTAGDPMNKSPGGGPARPHYGPQMTQMQRFIFGVIPLPCHIIFTGHVEAREDQTTGKIHFYPKIIGNIRNGISSWFNETYQTFRKRDKDKVLRYYLDTCGDENRLNFLKSSINRPFGSLWKDHIEVDLTKKPAGLNKLINLYEERRKA